MFRPAMEPEQYDYIVVGGGSAGCIVASELSKDREVSVVLVESGDPAEDHPETLRADGYKDAFINDAVIWERFSVPQPSCGGQRLFMGSGRGLGGSGSVNGMVYTRGAKEDFEEWPEGWKWPDVAPAFEAVEEVLRVRPREPNEFNEAFIRAAVDVGFRRKDDLNDGDLGGVIGYEAMSYEGDRRRSSYVAFLRDDAERPNLTLRTRAMAEKILFEGTRAAGVDIVRDGRRERLTARREVVVCAGALETPKLLLLSGIGPADHLAEVGIPLVADVPRVGANLHDHPNVTLFFRGPRDVDCNYPQLYSFHRANESSDLPTGQADTCYVAYPARSSLREAAMRLVPTMVPGWLYGSFVKWCVRTLISVVFAFGFVRRFIRRTYGIVVILGKPKSRGSLRLASADPSEPARIDPAYFDDPEDLATMLRGVGLARKIAHALEPWGNRPLLPRIDDETEVTKWIEKNAMTTYHYAGTCRLGEDAESVVDGELRLRGVQGVRVADASVIPFTPVSALNAPSMMIGYRAAQFVRAARSD